MKFWPFEQFEISVDQPSEKFVETLPERIRTNGNFASFIEGRSFVVAPKIKMSRFGEYFFFGNIQDIEGRTQIAFTLKDRLFLFRLGGVLIFPLLMACAIIYRINSRLAPPPPFMIALSVVSLISASTIYYALMLRAFNKMLGYKESVVQLLKTHFE